MYSEIASNKRRTVIIMACFMVLAGGLAWLFGKYVGSPSITIAVIIGALVYATIMYFAGGRMSLALNGAHEIQKNDNPQLWRVIENLAITDGLPMPRVFVIDDRAPNAFATGRDPKHAAVCATTGLLAVMDDTELQGVFAHELGHVKNYDIRVSMIAFALSAVISIIADVILRMTFFRSRDEENNNQVFIILGIVAAIVAPLVATLIQLAISRKREYLADATGALTTRYPEGLISALRKIEQTGSSLRRQNTSTAHFFFANPLRGHSITNLFSTHPPIEERIRRLESMGTHA
ncbi:MAG TPA: M48 family metalloprotease [Candidatus Saccharimonadales bacterium]|jgi:heat shock protein HtpX|nr:M48 family metalloprotease [Candidatus Saccharimonadales bacterium]